MVFGVSGARGWPKYCSRRNAGPNASMTFPAARAWALPRNPTAWPATRTAFRS
jgi:hypothetical protein